jgi:phosphoribosylformylglycinamidine cyclo-ligase
LGAIIDTSTWQIPPVFDLVSDRGVGEDEMFRTFNMGIGFCLVIDSNALADVAAAVGQHDPTVIGRITAGDGVDLS